VLIDSHVNLHAPAFADDHEAVTARARAAGVGGFLLICDRLDNVGAIRALTQGRTDRWRTVGVHPHEAQHFAQLDADALAALCAEPDVVAVGECGLDHHYDRSPREVQRRVFAAHVEAAQACGLPLVVHTREADDDTRAVLEAGWARGPLKVLLHCYTSGPDLLRWAADRGAWFSVSGIAAFKAADDVRARVREMPADRILVETDCPYLAPPPHRGRRNEPAYLPLVAEKLAEIRGWTADEAARRTTAAFFDLFDRAKFTPEPPR
jgi:TatD DNase family protein